MKKSIAVIAILFCIFLSGIGQTMQDTVFTFHTADPVAVDGQADDACWANAEWHVFDQVWIPYNGSMSQGDFEGKFKVAWDTDYLYLLVEVVDNMLSDDHSNPLQNWWDDDCVEVFIDENRSMGNHERNNNAFAYHVSLSYDVIDLNSSGGPVNYKDNLEVEMDTIGENTYLWEMAIKMYDASFIISNPEASRVYLSADKLMGFSIAYCDNDETSSRENFIGFMEVSSATANDSYKNASLFGPMKLKEFPTGIKNLKQNLEISVFPNPVKNQIRIELNQQNSYQKELSLYSVTGQKIKSLRFEENAISFNIGELTSGTYMLKINDGKSVYSKLILKD